ncbi:MAG: hypothetical protein B7C24_17355 [Bacteroidetes bacterium 4572_77]|nr:MAG: hypothetical protein B7C24_17355 [Bacteroidetes bacterium 4572_77]
MMMKQAKFYTGQNIQQTAHLTEETTLFDLYMSIVEPSPVLVQSIHSLIEVKSMGPEAYRKLKMRLPYFIGSQFKDNIRRAENFVSAHYFVMDLDHCLIDLDDEEKLKTKFRDDKRIALMFTSPGAEGLKLVFGFKNPIVNTQVFSNFYTAFAQEFAKHYGLEKYVDFSTKDASRICFFSIDPKAYINEEYIAVDADKYVSTFDLLNQEKQEESKEPTPKEGLTDDKYADILKKLNPKTPKKKKEYFVPEIIVSVFSVLQNKAKKWGLPIVMHKDISYGKQLIFEKDKVKAIVNLYYGKRGFSIVATNKQGSNERFAEICVRFIESVVYEPEKVEVPYAPTIDKLHAIAQLPVHKN